MLPFVILFGLKFHKVTKKETLAFIEQTIQEEQKIALYTPNVDFVMLAQKDQNFRQLINSGDLIIVDSQPLLISSKWLGQPLPEKVSGSDLLPAVCELAAKKEYSLFFLGAAPNSLEKALEKLKAAYPGLSVVGKYSPPKGFEKSEEEGKKILTLINQSKPDILFVALGSPKQEEWIDKNKEHVISKVNIGVGASIDFIAGVQKRAPCWMQKAGLEWFYRLLTNPKRLWKRYLVNDFPFVFLFLKEYFSSRN